MKKLTKFGVVLLSCILALALAGCKGPQNEENGPDKEDDKPKNEYVIYGPNGESAEIAKAVIPEGVELESAIYVDVPESHNYWKNKDYLEKYQIPEGTTYLENFQELYENFKESVENDGYETTEEGLNKWINEESPEFLNMRGKNIPYQYGLPLFHSDYFYVEEDALYYIKKVTPADPNLGTIEFTLSNGTKISGIMIFEINQ